MLDVHPPHEAAHTWKDFFLHIATIVVGLLIAIGLEQTVEAIHHHQQRRELRESLLVDARDAVRDTSDVHAYADSNLQWLSLRIDQVRQAIATGQPVAPSPPESGLNFSAPDDPAWKAARSTDLTELLTEEEIKMYNDVDGDVAAAERYHQIMNDATAALMQFSFKFTGSGMNTPDFSTASPQDLKQLLELLAAAKKSQLTYAEKCQELHGAEAAILRGENTLRGVQNAELNPW
jgi:hypothetical protein